MVVDKPTHILSCLLFVLELGVKVRALLALSMLSVVYSLKPSLNYLYYIIQCWWQINSCLGSKGKKKVYILVQTQWFTPDITGLRLVQFAGVGCVDAMAAFVLQYQNFMRVSLYPYLSYLFILLFILLLVIFVVQALTSSWPGNHEIIGNLNLFIPYPSTTLQTAFLPSLPSSPPLLHLFIYLRGLFF